MLELGWCLRFEFRNDALGQHLAKLHSPLVERVNVLDDALSEDRVLIKRDELAERGRREAVGEDRV